MVNMLNGFYLKSHLNKLTCMHMYVTISWKTPSKDAGNDDDDHPSTPARRILDTV